MENLCPVCYVNDFEECMSLTFKCNHWMCLDCLVDYQSKYNSCHICRSQINYKNFKLSGGKSSLMLINFSGDYIPIYNINFDKMTNLQLCIVVELKLNGIYNDNVRILYSGVQLSTNNQLLNSNRIPLINHQTLHCCVRLRGD
jgi:hypothetical protein